MKKGKDIQVNTLIIGAGRSGTTSLYAHMEQHRGVCFSSIKEVHYFSIGDLYKKGHQYYHSFFKHYKNEPVIASADTYLMIDHAAIERIREYNPGMKLVIMLRDRVDRAYSSYNYSINYGHHEAYSSFLDSMDIEAGIGEEENIVKRNNEGHFHASLYYKHLAMWTAVFPREQILVLHTTEMKNDPAKLSARLFSFLGLEGIQAEIPRANAAAIPKNQKLEKFLLDRDAGPRKIFRRLVPAFLKNMIMNSGLVDKLHDVNRKEHRTEPLGPDERGKAEAFFEEDKRLLAEKWGVSI